VFYGGNSFPSGNATRGCEKVDPCPGKKVRITPNISTRQYVVVPTNYINQVLLHTWGLMCHMAH